jgi:hypothetical protein
MDNWMNGFDIHPFIRMFVLDLCKKKIIINDSWLLYSFRVTPLRGVICFFKFQKMKEKFEMTTNNSTGTVS